MMIWPLFIALSALLVWLWVRAYEMTTREARSDALAWACFLYSCMATIGPLAVLLFVFLPYWAGEPTP